MSGGIVWIASYPKSGNTWLRAFLANLMTGAKTPFDINKLSDFTLSDMRAGYFEEVARRPVAAMDDEEINRLRPAVHRYLASRSPNTVLVKTHHTISRIKDIPTITPEVTAGAVYIVRNPLDLVSSYASHMGCDIDTAIELMGAADNHAPTAGRVVFQFLGSWSGHVTSWTTAPGLTRHVMKYEDMLETPAETFGELVRFLTFDATPQRIKRAIRFSSFKELKKQEKSKGFRERSQVAEAFFRQGRHGAWQDALSPAQVDRIVKAHGEAMERFGYLP